MSQGIPKRGINDESQSKLDLSQPQYGGEMVQLGGLEPPTFGSTNRRSNQLSYNCMVVMRLAASAADFKCVLHEN
jgi:hypothetical protein